MWSTVNNNHLGVCLNKLLADSIEEQNVLREEINKLKDDSKKKQEEARKLVDEIVAQIEHSCGANAGWWKHI